LEEAFDRIAPFCLPLEGSRLSVPLQDSGFRMELLSRVEVEAGVSPEVRNRARYEHLISLPPQ